MGAALVALVIALALIFAGRFVIRFIAFFGVGVAFASAAAAFGALILGIFGFVIGAIVGFLVGGVLSFFLLPLAIGVATGLLGYDLSQLFVHVYPVSVAVGVIFFLVGLLLSMRLLALASVIFGGLLLFDVLVFFHFPPLVALLIASLMGIIGFWTQDGFEQKGRQGYRFASWSRSPPPYSAVVVSSPPPSQPANGTVRRCSYCGTPIDNQVAVFCPNCGARLPG